MADSLQKLSWTDPNGVTKTITLTDEEYDNLWRRAMARSLTLTPTEISAGLTFNKVYIEEFNKYELSKWTAVNGENIAPTAADFRLAESGINPKTYRNSATDATSGNSILTMMQDAKSKCSWNLPPHLWSLPTRLDGFPTKKGDRFGNPVQSNPAARRGKLYYYYTNPNLTNVLIDPSKTKEATATGGASLSFVKTADRTTAPDRYYGFQFMWNPETYGIQTALQNDMVPSSGDIFVRGQGMFPGTASVQFTVRLDRVNDFACLANVGPELYNSVMSTYYSKDTMPESALDLKNPGMDRVSPDKHKLDWLLNLGTMADVEYLYRAINDPVLVQKVLPNGFKSADVGYLAFSLVAVELGPVFYIGYLTGLSINHLMFTENYVPIRSDVTIGMNLMAQASPASATVYPAGTAPKTLSSGAYLNSSAGAYLLQ